MRDASSATLEREAQRLAALLESGRAQSRAMGTPVVWRLTRDGFEFQGVQPGSLPDKWLGDDTQVRGTDTLQLGPEPIIEPQAVTLTSASRADRSLRVATDGLRPFFVQSDSPP